MNPEAMNSQSEKFDVIVVGSGFGGSVTAMRLSQKGYRVAVLESGKRYRAKDFPRTNWNVRKYFWFPLLRCFGFQKMTLLKGVMVLHGTGVGGGSLVYANTLMKPEPPVFKDPAWPRQNDWNAELEEHYATARKMLGVTKNPFLAEGEEALKEVGRRMGVEKTFHATEVGVYFNDSQARVKDPYFNGAGPDRGGCNFCGGCMVGCRFEAKNTLDYNYLFFAEKWGTKVFPETRVTRIVPPLEPGREYVLETIRSTRFFPGERRSFAASKVVLSAGALGTTELLLKNRDHHETLPDLSPSLGDTVRTNGESLLGVTSFEAHRNLSRGIAIGAAIHPDANTKIESVRYPSGSGAMRFLAVPLTGDGNFFTRPLKMIWQTLKRFPGLVKIWTQGNWAKHSLILLVMQSVDSKMKLRLGRSLQTSLRLGLKGAPAVPPVPSYLEVAQKAALHLADVVHGEPQNILPEVILKTPATAHILGGCCIGEDSRSGVIDSEHQVFGYPGLFVCDGSVIPANLAVNPSLTITALAERFTSFWPVRDSALFAQRQITFTSRES